MAQPDTQGLQLASPLLKRFRAMEGGQETETWLGIAQVAEEDLIAGALVVVDEPLFPAS